MAFWGVEVKPGQPFIHEYDDSKGRLHVSMATLGLGSSANARSTLQCNVGNRSPVYLCSLYPGDKESLQLDLEFEEHGEVVFSVIGPNSIHLCGYYLSASHIHHPDDREPYGEDIAYSETDASDCSDDEDDCDDSFIDDDSDPEVFSSSPISAKGEASHDNIPKGKKGSFRRLRKKYQSVESDDDGCDEENGSELKMEKMTQGNNQQQHAEDKEAETIDKILPSSQVDHRHGEKRKKKRKEWSKEAVLLVATDASHDNLDLSQSHEYSKQHAVNESVYNGAHEFPGGNQSEDKKVKKRKKSKNQGNGEVPNSEMMEDRNKREDRNPSQVKILSNGLVIEKLEKGKKDGKIAASGKKISIYYTGKLKENGIVFESNAGQAPLKFRLGKGKVMEGWNVGLEGMQVGEKRRLEIPPSLMSESHGHSAKIPPNSWLVYDFELVKVH